MVASIHTTSTNAVTLVWGSLRLAPNDPLTGKSSDNGVMDYGMELLITFPTTVTVTLTFLCFFFFVSRSDSEECGEWSPDGDRDLCFRLRLCDFSRSREVTDAPSSSDPEDTWTFHAMTIIMKLSFAYTVTHMLVADLFSINCTLIEVITL